MILNSKHFFLSSSSEVDQIIQPLKQYFGINSFIYKKNFNDGSELRLSNQPAWTEVFYKENYSEKSVFEKKPSHYLKSKILWDELPNNYSAPFAKMRELNIAHGITFIEPGDDGCEFFSMGIPSGSFSLMHRYLSRLDLLEKFLIYFRERAQDLIIRADKNRVLIPGKFDNAPMFLIEQKVHFDQTGFLKAIDSSERVQQNFSIREIQCAERLLHGYTIKMIGQELKLSPRTIEGYIKSVKQKTGALNKADLIRGLSKFFS